MGYAGFSLKEISHALLPRSGGTGAGVSGLQASLMRTWGKLSFFSDFLQDIYCQSHLRVTS